MLLPLLVPPVVELDYSTKNGEQYGCAHQHHEEEGHQFDSLISFGPKT